MPYYLITVAHVDTCLLLAEREASKASVLGDRVRPASRGLHVVRSCHYDSYDMTGMYLDLQVSY